MEQDLLHAYTPVGIAGQVLQSAAGAAPEDVRND
jgi:hypothetical protein